MADAVIRSCGDRQWLALILKQVCCRLICSADGL